MACPTGPFQLSECNRLFILGEEQLCECLWECGPLWKYGPFPFASAQSTLFEKWVVLSAWKRIAPSGLKPAHWGIDWKVYVTWTEEGSAFLTILALSVEVCGVASLIFTWPSTCISELVRTPAQLWWWWMLPHQHLHLLYMQIWQQVTTSLSLSGTLSNMYSNKQNCSHVWKFWIVYLIGNLFNL